MGKYADGDNSDDPRFTAALDLLRRTGAQSFQIRYQDDEQPVVWMAVVEHLVGPDRRPVPASEGGAMVWEVDAGHTPLEAVLRLCARLVDGGYCVHCHRGTAFAETHDETTFADELICWTQYDPELKTFRRACEGDTDG